MTILLEALVAVFLVIGGIFGLVGSVGLIKLEEPMRRLHAPTKATTLGVGGVLLASILNGLVAGLGLSVREVLITVFLFVTAPVSALFIAKTYMHRNIRPEDLPPTGRPSGWAAYDDPPEDRAESRRLR